MKNLVIKPSQFPCTLAECPPGHFLYGKSLCFKSEYKDVDGKIEAFCESGEFFVAGTKSEEERRGVRVEPVHAVWEDV
jgi:hypothetical protein